MIYIGIGFPPGIVCWLSCGSGPELGRQTGREGVRMVAQRRGQIPRIQSINIQKERINIQNKVKSRGNDASLLMPELKGFRTVTTQCMLNTSCNKH